MELYFWAFSASNLPKAPLGLELNFGAKNRLRISCPYPSNFVDNSNHRPSLSSIS